VQHVARNAQCAGGALDAVDLRELPKPRPDREDAKTPARDWLHHMKLGLEARRD
jgi:hypothetical protein